MPSKPRVKVKALVRQPGHCLVCGHLLAEVKTESGDTLLLDTHIPTWVIGGNVHKESGLPIVVPSRGYPVHLEPCHG